MKRIEQKQNELDRAEEVGIDAWRIFYFSNDLPQNVIKRVIIVRTKPLLARMKNKDEEVHPHATHSDIIQNKPGNIQNIVFLCQNEQCKEEIQSPHLF